MVPLQESGGPGFGIIPGAKIKYRPAEVVDSQPARYPWQKINLLGIKEVNPAFRTQNEIFSVEISVKYSVTMQICHILAEAASIFKGINCYMCPRYLFGQYQIRLGMTAF